MKIHHIAISVPDKDLAYEFYKKHFGFEETLRFDRSDLCVSGIMAEIDGTTLEFLQSTEQADDTALSDRSPNFSRQGLNHFCILVNDIEMVSEGLRQDGVSVPEIIDGKKTKMVFFTDPFGCTVELYQYK